MCRKAYGFKSRLPHVCKIHQQEEAALKIETFDREDHQKKVIAELDNETLERFRRQAARKISQEARIPGFRPGKAPYEVIRRMYGDEAIIEQAINLMVDDVYPQVIKETQISPAGPGSLEEVLSIEPPRFSFIIPLAPEVDLGDYRAIRADYIAPEIDDAKVEEVILRLQRRSATAEPVERASETGDMVAVKFSGHLTKPDEGQEASLVEETSQQMIAGDASEHTDPNGNEWPFPGFAQALVGVSAGEKKVVNYTFPVESDVIDDLNGKEAEFTLEIESVKSLTLPELNDEFAQSLGEYATIDALRNEIRTSLQENETQTYNRKYFDDLIASLVSGAAVKYPPTLLQGEIDHMLEHFEEDLARDNLDLMLYLKTRDMTREQLVEQEVKPVAERSVIRQLVLEEFAYREEIQIKPEEVQMVYNMASAQAKSNQNLQGLGRGKLTNKQLTDTLARSTINEIFNQRLINRLRAIATGEADKVDETEQPVTEQAAEVEPVSPSTEETTNPAE